MAVDIDDAFVKQFESEVKLAYQRMGAKLRGSVRTKSGIVGKSTTFQKMGSGTMGTKARHGNIPIMNVDHSNVECTLADYYAGDYVDKLDELKINHDERGALSNTVAYAAGRKTDELILTALDTTANANNVGTSTTYSAMANWLAFMEAFGNADIPDDGQRYAVISWGAWGDLLQLAQFASMDYVPTDQLTAGTTAKRWLSFYWMPHSGLPVGQGGGTARKCFFYHSTAVGHAIAQEPSSQWDWIPEKAAYLVQGSMSQGAVMIDDTGVIELNYSN